MRVCLQEHACTSRKVAVPWQSIAENWNRQIALFAAPRHPKFSLVMHAVFSVICLPAMTETPTAQILQFAAGG